MSCGARGLEKCEDLLWVTQLSLLGPWWGYSGSQLLPALGDRVLGQGGRAWPLAACCQRFSV